MLNYGFTTICQVEIAIMSKMYIQHVNDEKDRRNHLL